MAFVCLLAGLFVGMVVRLGGMFFLVFGIRFRLQIVDDPLRGKGVVTCECIPPDVPVLVYLGERLEGIHACECAERSHEAHDRGSYIIFVHEKHRIIGFEHFPFFPRSIHLALSLFLVIH